MRSHEGRPAAGLLGAQQRRGGEGEREVRRGEVVAAVQPSGRASKKSIRMFVITEKAPTRAFSCAGIKRMKAR